MSDADAILVVLVSVGQVLAAEQSRRQQIERELAALQAENAGLKAALMARTQERADG